MSAICNKQELKQTVKEFLQPFIQAWLDAETNYTNNRVQIIRAKAELECQQLLKNDDKAAKKRKLIERLERKHERLSNKTHWTEAILKPLALHMVEVLNGYTHEIMGPFGISCETSIWIYPSQEDAESRTLDNLYSVTFISHYEYESGSNKIVGINLTIKDYSVHKQRFPKGSIGDLNGMNHPNIDIMNWSMEQLIDRFRNRKCGD